MDSNVEADAEVLRHEGGHVVALEHHLALEESTLGDTGVLNLRLDNHDRLVLEEVVDEHLVHSVVFETSFNDALFEVTVEAENLNYN